MSDEDLDDTAGGSDRDPDVDTAGSSAEGGGSGDPDHAAGGDSRDPAKRTDPDASASDGEDSLEDALAVAMAPDGEVAKPDADAGDEKPEEQQDDQDGDDAKGEKPEAEKAEDDKGEDDGEKGDKPDEPYSELVPTDAERRALSKTANKRLDKLLELRHPARFGELVATAAVKNGFVEPGEEGAEPKLDGHALRHWLETGGKVNTAPPDEAAMHLAELVINVRAGGPEKAKALPAAERARLLREMADRIAPAPPAPEPEVITLPAELQDAVDAGTLDADEAKQLARARAEKAKAKQPGAAKEAEKAPEKPAKEQDQAKTWFSADEHQKGLDAAMAEYRKAAAKYPQDWKRFSKEVVARVTKLAPDVHPRAYAQLVRDSIEIVIAKRVTPTKAPPRSPGPTQAPPAKKGEEMTDDDLLDLTINPR